MITIIEGPDACGKTTLARAFGKARVYHQGPYDGDPFNETIAAVRAAQTPAVFDRLHIGEHVYGPLLRGCDTLSDPAEIRLLDRVLLTHRAVVVMALPSLGVALSSWNATRLRRSELITSTAQFKASYAMFQEEVRKLQLPYVLFDFTKDAVSLIRERVESVRPVFNGGPGAGSFRAGVTLLVGEKVGEGVGWQDYPFLGLVGSSRWLARKLNAWGVPERDLYWVNALRPDETWEHPGFIDALRPAKIIALGNVAASWLRGTGHLFEMLPHPQFWKRFHYQAEYPLKEALCGS